MNTQSEVEIPYKSGFVVLVGKPNAGKSTLLNHLLSQKIAAVSFRPQTTQKRQYGILTTPDAQIIFVDTPGLHHPQYKLSHMINAQALNALEDADVILFLVDVTQPPDDQDHQLAALIEKNRSEKPVLLALNKCDLISKNQLSSQKQALQELINPSKITAISALTGENIEPLITSIKDFLPLGPQYYPLEQITDQMEKEIAAELIRAACLTHLEAEVPYSIAVQVDEFSEREDGSAFIYATLYVEREAQKGIVIGKGGEMIKQIGITARQEIEAMRAAKVFLELRVKVEKNWRNNPAFLKRIGF
jgi:GTP-binding protein Era